MWCKKASCGSCADPVFNDPEHKKAWLIVTAANVCKNYLARSERKNLALPDWDQASDDGQHPSPGHSTPYNETSVLYGDGPAPYSETPDLCGENPSISDRDCQLLACLGQLPARLRLTLYLYFYEGYNSQEISEMPGIHPASVRRRLSEARRLIKNYGNSTKNRPPNLSSGLRPPVSEPVAIRSNMGPTCR